MILPVARSPPVSRFYGRVGGEGKGVFCKKSEIIALTHGVCGENRIIHLKHCIVGIILEKNARIAGLLGLFDLRLVCLADAKVAGEMFRRPPICNIT